MRREIELTADGSHTVSIPELLVTYHSKHGAIQESMQVFINPGLSILLSAKPTETICVLEIGFGTGLNALLSWQAASQYNTPVHLTSLEPFPLSDAEINSLNYGTLLSMGPQFTQIHTCPWEKENALSTVFTLEKKKISLLDFTEAGVFHCIYFDAFAPSVQPELWTKPVFEKLFSVLLPGGMLLTYCSKSSVRHDMTAAGFLVTKIPGPRGKREMVRAEKR